MRRFIDKVSKVSSSNIEQTCPCKQMLKIKIRRGCFCRIIQSSQGIFASIFQWIHFHTSTLHDTFEQRIVKIRDHRNAELLRQKSSLCTFSHPFQLPLAMSTTKLNVAVTLTIMARVLTFKCCFIVINADFCMFILIWRQS